MKEQLMEKPLSELRQILQDEIREATEISSQEETSYLGKSKTVSGSARLTIYSKVEA